MRLFDLHCDTLSECCQKKQDLKHNDLQLSLERGAGYAPWCQVFAIWVPDGMSEEAACRHVNRCIGYMEQQAALHKDAVWLCSCAEEMDCALQKGRLAAVLAVEGGGTALCGSMERLHDFYDRGIRLLTLTWNGRCSIGDGALAENGRGLTPFGRNVVKECEALGVIVDVSHLNETGFWDVAGLARQPFVASHSNAKAVCDHPRNLTDGQFRCICERGGLVGINLYPGFLTGAGDASFEDIERHIAHFLNLDGEKVLCLGTDFDGADMPSVLPDAAALPGLYGFLRGKGYKEDFLEDFFFNNAYRFFKSTLQNS